MRLLWGLTLALLVLVACGPQVLFPIAGARPRARSARLGSSRSVKPAAPRHIGRFHRDGVTSRPWQLLAQLVIPITCPHCRAQHSWLGRKC